MSDRNDRQVAPILLAIGAALGIGLALIGTFTTTDTLGSRLPAGIVASVNGTAITVEEYGRALASFESSRRDAAREEDKAYVLDRLIEEELLIQRGIDIGLADNDRSVRSAIVRSMIDTIVAESTARAVSEDDLREFFEDNISLFAKPRSLHVRILLFQSVETATEALKLLRQGNGIETLEAVYDISVDPVVPATLLPPHKLREYIGPSAVEAALSLDEGAFSDPLDQNGRPFVIELVDKEDAQEPDFETLKSQIEFAYRTQRDDQALRDYLQRLKGNAEIARADLDDIVD